MKKLIALVLFTLFAACSQGNGKPVEPGEKRLTTTNCRTCSNVTPQQPVILVHGRNDTSARWNTLVTNWSSRGYTENVNLFRINMTVDCGANDYCSQLPSYPAASVNESYAMCLKAYIDQKVPSGEAVDIVTHSQGGITARYYTRFLASPRVVNDMSNMAGLNQGTKNCTLAGACTGINPESCPDSAFMHKLNGVAPEGDGTNDETPGASPNGPVQYDAIVSSGDTVISPYCSGYYILNPQTTQADDMNCKSPNYTLDSEADSCKITGQHLTVPTNTTAINHAYCQINED